MAAGARTDPTFDHYRHDAPRPLRNLLAAVVAGGDHRVCDAERLVGDGWD